MTTFFSFQATTKARDNKEDLTYFDRPAEKSDTSFQNDFIDRNQEYGNPTEKHSIEDNLDSDPQKSPSRSFYSIVESAFPEHKYLQNQRTTYVER